MDHTGEQIMQLLEQPPMHSVGGEQTADVLAFDQRCGEGVPVLGAKSSKQVKTECTQSRRKLGRSRSPDEGGPGSECGLLTPGTQPSRGEQLLDRIPGGSQTLLQSPNGVVD